MSSPTLSRRDPPALSLAVLLAAIMGIGTALRVVRIGDKSFWLDEAFSVALVRTRWPTFVHLLVTREANMGPYYLLLRPWLQLGSDEATIRSLSALAAILTIPVVYAIGARLFGPRAGVVAALLLTVDPLHLWAAQEARGYALVILLLTGSTWAFVNALDRSTTHASVAAPPPDAPQRTRAGWWALYVATSALAMYTHFFAALVLFAQWCSLIARRDRIPWRPLVASGAVIAVLLTPLMRFFSGAHDNIDWLGHALTVGLPATLHAVFHRAGFTALGIYVVLILVVLALSATISRDTTSRREHWTYWLPILWVALPPAIAVLVTLTVKPVLDPRYLVVCVPGFSLATASWIDRVQIPRWRTAALLGVLAIEIVGIWAYETQDKKEDWRGATAMVFQAARPGDVVVFYAPYVRRAYDYYARLKAEPAAPLTEKPRELYPSVGYADFSPDTGPVLTLGEAVDRGRLAGRTWLIVSHVGGDQACVGAVDAALRESLPVVTTRAFVAIDVRLYAPRPASPASAASPPPLLPRSEGANTPGETSLHPRSRTDSLLAQACPQH